MTARRLDQILSDTHGSLNRLQLEAQRLAALNRRLYELLPAPLHEHVRLVAAEPDRVALRASSAAWLTRLRFQLPQVKRLLRESLGLKARRVEIAVLRRSFAPAPTRTQLPSVSTLASRYLDDAADLSGDDELAQALRRLAARGRQG